LALELASDDHEAGIDLDIPLRERIESRGGSCGAGFEVEAGMMERAAHHTVGNQSRGKRRTIVGADAADCEQLTANSREEYRLIANATGNRALVREVA
jgi:hypothetical protein